MPDLLYMAVTDDIVLATMNNKLAFDFADAAVNEVT